MHPCALRANCSRPSRLCVRVCVYTRIYVRSRSRCPSIINTQSYGRLNTGSPPPIHPFPPFPDPEADNYLRHSSRWPDFVNRSWPRFVSIAVDKIISPSHHLPRYLYFPFAFRLFARFQRADEHSGKRDTLRIGRHCHRLFDRLIATAVHMRAQTHKRSAVKRRKTNGVTLYWISVMTGAACPCNSFDDPDTPSYARPCSLHKRRRRPVV